jgi:hypothetical protein
MPDARAQRPNIRELILSGRLPRVRPERTWGGPGVGADCMVCGRPVRNDEVELEVEFGPADTSLRGRIAHAHVACFDAWEHELGQISANLSPPEPAGTLRERVGSEAETG